MRAGLLLVIVHASGCAPDRYFVSPVVWRVPSLAVERLPDDGYVKRRRIAGVELRLQHAWETGAFDGNAHLVYHIKIAGTVSLIVGTALILLTEPRHEVGPRDRRYVPAVIRF